MFAALSDRVSTPGAETSILAPKFEKDTIQKLQKVSGLIFEVDEGDEEESVENEQTEQQKVVRPKPIMKVRRV